MKKLSLLLCGACFGISLNSQNVNIPDANFKAALVANAAINTNMDSEIQVSEAIAFTGSISVPNLSISNLTGIEAFTNIWMLDCQGNQLSSINVTFNAALQELNCSSNQLTAVNVSSNAQLTRLFCDNNLITSLNLASNPNLVRVECCMNQMTALNLSANPLVYGVSCCLNQIAILDLSMLTALTSLNCSNNQLTWLNVANGNNTNVVFFAANNNNLGCIEVDDTVYSNNNWANIDPGAWFSLDCGNAGIFDPEFDDLFSVYPVPAVNLLSVIPLGKHTPEQVSIFNIAGEEVFSSKNFQDRIDISGFSSGAYCLRVQTGDLSVSKLFTVQK